MALEKYIQKRKFNVTPEPKGKVERSKNALKFVIQKHQASRLHYDFRLEMEGVLKSWAVPKGPSLNPKDKRLAMMTEDHPMSYRTFEGTIPEGEYGGGDVIVWDEGTYEADGVVGLKPGEKALLAGLAKGEIKFTMHGTKVNGSFALVKMHGRQENAWLLVKHKDEYASTKDITLDESSVRSDASLGNKPHAKITVQNKKARKKAVSSSARTMSMPHAIKPMLAQLVKEPFDDPNWIYEIKWDGYRAVSEVEKGKVSLYSRSGQDFSKRYPSVVKALEKIGHDVVLDGEVVVVDSTGKTRFQYLQNYAAKQDGHMQYQVFDILYCDGVDLRNQPLLERKEILRKIIPKSAVIKYSDHVQGKGKAFFNSAVKQGLEGIMAKDGQSRYITDVRTDLWLKIKTHNRQEVIICGYTEPQGSRHYFGSLILGVYEKQGKKNVLRYVGHTGTGFNQKSLKEIYNRLQPLTQKKSPFEKTPKTNAPATWVKPELLGEVEFTEWTEDGQMRHPSFQGLREPDKAVQSVKKEEPIMNPQRQQSKKFNSNSSVNITHPDKIYWPKDRITKGDLIEYYTMIAPVILPYLKDRLESLHRFPDGIDGESFYQKNITYKTPDFVQTEKVRLETEKRTINSIVCNNVETLLYLANLGCIELNPWNSKVDSIENPDWAVIDLDPGDISFNQVIKVAQAVHELLEDIGVPSYPKTSGKTGLHIFIPTGGKYTHDQVKQFVEIVVTLIHRQLPKITSLERSPDKRTKLIYLDYLQNRIGQTLAAPYSARPWPGATVSTPLLWEEVVTGLRPKQFTIKNIQARLEKLGDIWKPVLGKGFNLRKALKALESID